MSFAAEVKQEVAQKIMEGNDIRAELSALIQMTSSLSLSSRGMTFLVSLENAAVSRTIYRLVKERYGVEISLFVKRKMNLRKNRIYGMRIMSAAPKILEDLGIYSTRGLLDKPLAKIVQTNNNARAYLAGAFMAGGSINSPEKSSYHLEITATSEEHALFMASLLERFNIHAKITTRRKKVILYVKSAEKIADFLRLIEADQAVLKFENIRISRDFSNSLQRMNNMDLANEVKAVAAASGQLEDIRILEENQRVETLDRKLQDIIALRKANPEASLMELCGIYERQTGEIVSKSGMKHRFVKLHELAMKEVKQDE